MSGGRVARIVVAVTVVLSLAGCGAATQSPKEQTARERKAAGLATFRIVGSRDLWDQTGGDQGKGLGTATAVEAKIGARNDGLVNVDLTGPALVELLKYLDGKAHPGWLTGRPDQRAVRMYNAIAPRVDAIRSVPRGTQPVPEVVINDSTGGGASPSTSPSSPHPSRG